MGILAGMLVAVFITYRKPRHYQIVSPAKTPAEEKEIKINATRLTATMAALVVALICQLRSDLLFVGAMAGFVILSSVGIFRWRDQDDVFTEGLRMMAQIAVIITIASGFAGC